jgi:hypothetical protein
MKKSKSKTFQNDPKIQAFIFFINMVFKSEKGGKKNIFKFDLKAF